MLLSIDDIRKIGQIANNCDLEKLKIAEREAFDFDLKPLISCYFFEVRDNWYDTEGVWHNIVNEKRYDTEGCGNCGYHVGLKTILSYFTYARYLILNEFNDTPSGNVVKTNNFSMPTNIKLLKDRSNAYREMATASFAEVKEYMIINRDSYPEFFSREPVAKGFGVRIRNVY